MVFFGLLIEVHKISDVFVDTAEFIQLEGEDIYITTKALAKNLSEWEQNEKILSKHDREAHFRRQQSMIMIAIQFRLQQISGQWWEDTPLHWVDRPEESHAVALPLPFQMSIAILGETLERASRRALGSLKRSSMEPMVQNDTLTYELNTRAWCPSEISFVLEGPNDTSAFFASLLERRRLQADHSQCSANKCRAFNIVTE